MQVYLTPAAIGYLTQLILAALISGYFAYLLLRSPRQAHRRWLTAGFTLLSGFLALMFLDAALLPTPRLGIVFLENTLLGLTLVCLIQFAYHFPNQPAALRREARLALILSGVYTLGEAIFAAYRFVQLGRGLLLYRHPWLDFLLLLLFLWVPFGFLRQIHSLESRGGKPFARFLLPADPAARACRTFALVLVFMASLNVFSILRSYDLVPGVVANLGISIGLLLALCLFALAYLNSQPEITSFMTRLAGVMLVVVLAILGVVGWVVSPGYAATYQPHLPDRRTLRFTPGPAGGYTVNDIPFSFETHFGSRLPINELPRERRSTSLAFEFSFYGQAYQEVFVYNDPVLSFDQDVSYRLYQYHYGGGNPLIYALLIDLDPDKSPGGIYARQEPDRLIITWDRLPGYFQPEAVFTAQIVLHRSGVFEITYAGLPTRLIYQPDDAPWASLWAIGVVPARPTTGARPQLADLARVPLQIGSGGVVQDFLLDFRRHLHGLLAPLAGLILAASGLVVAGFPLLFYFTLVRPLNALLSGVRRLENGDYSQQVAVQIPDEIGFLTQAFNQTAQKLASAIHLLEQRVAERTQALSEAKEAAEAANRAKSTFLATMGHELRTPLTAILGFSEIMMRDPYLTPAQVEQLNIVHRCSEQLLGLINEVLDLSKIEARKFQTHIQTFDLYQLIQGLEDMFRLRAEQQGVALIFLCGPQVPRYINTDGGKLQQILTNLLGNAIKFTSTGSITLRVTLEERSLQFAVTDTGIGIAAEDQDRIFDPFVQLTGAGDYTGGTGLGLTISQQYVGLLGGRLEVSSQPGGGSTFAFDLPMTSVPDLDETIPETWMLKPVAQLITGEKNSHQAAAALQSPQPPFIIGDESGIADGSRACILVVDDTAENLSLLGEMLAPEFRVRLVKSGPDALAEIQSRPPDLILLDILMPDMDGFAVAMTLKNQPQTCDIPILFISALNDTYNKVRAFESGGVDYITKPFQEREVLARIRTHLAIQTLGRSLKTANERLEQQVTELQTQNQELAAFAHTVAHDLKNPLSNLLWSIHLLSREYASQRDTDLQPLFEMSLHTVETMDRSVEGLMLLAGLRKQAVEPHRLAMGPVVDHALACLTYLVRQAQAEIILPESWPNVVGYAPWVEEVWINYISNAIKYGGDPTTGLRPQVALGYDLPADNGAPGQIRFWVRDNGPGLPPEQQAQLFTPFERLSNVRLKGHGLGLSIVRRILDKLGGLAGVESQPGQGSTFYFTLPAPPEASETPAVPGGSASV